MLIDIKSRYDFHKEFIRTMNEKSEDQTYNYGCIMGYFDADPMSLLTTDADDYVLDDEDIYDNEEGEYGREIEPHVTILYGLHDDDIDEEEVIKLMNVIRRVNAKFNGISAFKNDKYDVLKWDIEADELATINKIVRDSFPYTSNFPDYHPHCTIAYLKPGTSDKYTAIPNNIVNLPISKWVYSKSNGKKIVIHGNGNMGFEVIREADDE